MENIKRSVRTGSIQGTCAAEFMAVADAFERNFDRNLDCYGEVGASVSVTVRGETVVDLWGGAADLEESTPWEANTICTVFSSTKGATALAAHTLIGRGELDIEAPVSRYWPEFAQNGKEAATVRMMLDHSVGVPAFREPLEEGGCCDWEYMIGMLEREAPFWEPGARNGYHMINFGWTVGELVRRVSGQSLGAYFKEAIADPTGAEFWIGLPEEQEALVARLIPFVPDKNGPIGAFPKAIMADRQSLQALALLNNGGFNPNTRACRAAEIGAAGGVTNGRGLARMYTPFACGGSLDGRVYVDADTLARMGEVAVATNRDATLLIPTRFSLGFMKSMDNRRRDVVDKDSVVISSEAFGHVGAGGSIGFADPAADMAFGYAMNRMGPGILLNERGQSLVDATYQALGYRSNQAGVWRR